MVGYYCFTHISYVSPSGKLTSPWKITIFHGKINYLYGPHYIPHLFSPLSSVLLTVPHGLLLFLLEALKKPLALRLSRLASPFQLGWKIRHNIYGCGSKWKTQGTTDVNVQFSIDHPIIGVPNFDPYPYNYIYIVLFSKHLFNITI